MWAKVVRFFHDSEIIFWGRLQVFAGVVVTFLGILVPIVSGTDFSVLGFTPKTIAILAIVNGILTEYLRRRRATDLGAPTDKISTE